MGIFGFGKKKDDLGDLKMPDLGGGDMPSFDSLSSQSDVGIQQGAQDSFDQPSLAPADTFSAPVQDPFAVPTQEPFAQPPAQDSFGSRYAPGMDANSQISSVPPVQSKTLSESTSDPTIRDHQLELITSKLDVLKAMVENLSQKVSSLETKIDLQIEQKKKSW